MRNAKVEPKTEYRERDYLHFRKQACSKELDHTSLCHLSKELDE